MAVNPADVRFDSWKAIAAYLGRDVSTVIRWEKDKGLPVHRLPGGRRQAVFALKTEIDAWLVGSLSGGQAAGGGPDPAPARADAAIIAERQEPSSLLDSPFRPQARRVVGGALVFSIVATLVWFGAVRPRPGVHASDTLWFDRHDVPLQSPYSLTTGDLNGDGRPDLVVTSYGTNLVHTFLAQPDGSFRQVCDSASGMKPDGVVVADFNGDGLLDAATGNRGSGTISIFRGNGDGTFQPRVDYHAGSAPRGVTAADLNGDGTPDVVAADFDGHAVTLFSNVHGVLQRPDALQVGTNPYQVRAADLNHDGLPDLVVGNVTPRPPTDAQGTAEYTLTILLGTRSGFEISARYDLGQGSSGIAIADLNGDGRPDLAVTDFDGNVCYVLDGMGNGTFQAPRTIQTGAAPLDVAVGDVDGDGVPDLVTANAHAKSLSILHGRGDGTFAPKVDAAVNSYPKSLVLGDFNHDGRLDIAVTNYLDNSISILLNTGNGLAAYASR